MAALRCPVCGLEATAPGETFCRIDVVPLVPGEPAGAAAAAPVASCPEPGCDNPAGPQGSCPLHAIGAPPIEMVTRLDTGAGRLALRFPWGTVEVSETELTVGRSAQASPLASHITDETYGNVSRCHAVVWQAGERLYIRDRGSTNGTLVNERPIATRTPHELKVGDQLRFGADLTATVVERPAGGLSG